MIEHDPTSTVAGPPDHLAGAWEILNAGRRAAGLPPLAGGDVTADPHHDFLERPARAGWPASMTAPPDARRGIGNYSECGSTGTAGPSRDAAGTTWPADPSGWSYPPMSAEALARQTVEIVTVGIKDPHEGHRKDFHTAWTHAGIGHAGGMFVVDYGYLPGGD
jgi:hypothetical protein